jgi:hypothetical protein
MEAQLRERLAALRAEFERGQQTLAGIDAQRRELVQALLRISGAIQVLEEELGRTGPVAGESVTELAQLDPANARPA